MVVQLVPAPITHVPLDTRFARLGEPIVLMRRAPTRVMRCGSLTRAEPA